MHCGISPRNSANLITMVVPDEFQIAGLTDENRKELIDYYKWIVSLAIFVLTVSLTLAGLFPNALQYSWLLVVGWVLLGLCIFFNWLLIKRLVTISIVFATPEEELGAIHDVFIRSIRNLQKYALLQNWLFLLGTFTIGVGFVLNVFNKP